jgi:nucleoside-triphosphatase THEP1
VKAPVVTNDSCIDSTILAAAIVDDRTVDLNTVLATVARHQSDAGRKVRGCLMERPPRELGCTSTMVLVDIDTAQRYLVSQPMGTNSKACRADTQAFARASQIFHRAIRQPPDLVISNRFGDLEVRGGGFSQELLEIMSMGIPLLTTVSERNVAAWQHFTGGSTLLPKDPASVTAWVEHALRSRSPADS